MLALVDVKSGYGSITVLSSVSLNVAKGEVVSVLGRNGVGKSTLMKTIIGLVRANAGAMTMNGAPFLGLAPDLIAKMGIAYVPQGRGIFGKMTVVENLSMGTRGRRDDAKDIPAEIFDLFPILAERRSQLAGTMSGGEQQQLSLGRALASSPDLLVLDEPSVGIQPNIVRMIGGVLRKLASEKGVGILLVEQNLDLGLSSADRVLFMEKGRIVHESKPKDLRDDTLHRYLAI